MPGSEKRNKIFATVFDVTTIPADILWHDTMPRDRFIARNEMRALPALNTLLARIFFHEKITKSLDIEDTSKMSYRWV